MSKTFNSLKKAKVGEEVWKGDAIREENRRKRDERDQEENVMKEIGHTSHQRMEQKKEN